MTPKEIGKKLTELRGIRTRTGVAKESGIGYSALCMYEHGQRVPCDDNKRKLADYYRVPISELFYADDKQTMDRNERNG